MYQISNAEYSVLSILMECEVASGYEINQIVEARGFREWADIGKTSVYTALKKLEHSDLIKGDLNRSKSGRGPVGRSFAVTATGSSLFVAETAQGLSTSREREPFFALAMAGSFVLSRPELSSLLQQRVLMLESEQDRIRRHMPPGDGLAFEAHLLFEYTFSRIRAEISFTKQVINELGEYV